MIRQRYLRSIRGTSGEASFRGSRSSHSCKEAAKETGDCSRKVLNRRNTPLALSFTKGQYTFFSIETIKPSFAFPTSLSLPLTAQNLSLPQGEQSWSQLWRLPASSYDDHTEPATVWQWPHTSKPAALVCSLQTGYKGHRYLADESCSEAIQAHTFSHGPRSVMPRDGSPRQSHQDAR